MLGKGLGARDVLVGIDLDLHAVKVRIKVRVTGTVGFFHTTPCGATR
jgi:hypothetical protein